MRYVKERTAADGSDLASRLAELFQVLNTPPERRLAVRDEAVATFPYVNGGLFAEMLPIAAFSSEMRKAILDYMKSDDFQPAITLTPETISHFFTKQAPAVDMFTKDSPDELKPKIK
jgi:hypothetical protein